MLRLSFLIAALSLFAGLAACSKSDTGPNGGGGGTPAAGVTQLNWDQGSWNQSNWQ